MVITTRGFHLRRPAWTRGWAEAQSLRPNPSLTTYPQDVTWARYVAPLCLGFLTREIGGSQRLPQPGVTANWLLQHEAVSTVPGTVGGERRHCYCYPWHGKLLLFG